MQRTRSAAATLERQRAKLTCRSKPELPTWPSRKASPLTEGNAKLEFKLGPGVYRAMLETQDRFGKKVTARLPMQVSAGRHEVAIKIPTCSLRPSGRWSQARTSAPGHGYDGTRVHRVRAAQSNHRALLDETWPDAAADQRQ